MPVATAEREARTGNRRWQVSGRVRLWLAVAAAGCGALLSAAFPPLECWWWGWAGLVPVLLLGMRLDASAFGLGYVFGLGHFVTCFAWLRTVTVAGPVLLGGFCALFPACWLWMGQALLRELQWGPEGLRPRVGNGAVAPRRLGLAATLVLVAWLAASWAALEWVRGWLFSGFPWNLLGVSQWQVGQVLPVSRLGGVYLIGFLMAAVNGALFVVARHVRWRGAWWLGGALSEGRAATSGPFVCAATLTVACCVAGAWSFRVPEPRATVRVTAVQGNIPECRFWTIEQLTTALEVYTGLTREAVRRDRPDLVVWPETAVPASLTHHLPCVEAMAPLHREIRTPLLAGTLVFEFPAGAPDPKAVRDYNAAVLFDAEGRVAGRYDKTHIVPFGEFVPLGSVFPWLRDAVGMGRDLTPGREFRVLEVAESAHAGVNICYEDAFPVISRRFVRRGANVLMVITNDSWFRETSGARQHLTHSVFRAVENGRPVLRCGNNSDTVLITADGRLVAPLVDPATGSAFTRGYRTYRVPIRDAGMTVYTVWGDTFAIGCFVVWLGGLGWLGHRHLGRKRALYGLVAGRGWAG